MNPREIHVKPEQLQTGASPIYDVSVSEIFAQLRDSLTNDMNKCVIYAVTSDGASAYKHNIDFKKFLLEQINNKGTEGIAGLVIDNDKAAHAWAYYTYTFATKAKVIYNTEAFRLPYGVQQWFVIGEQERIDYNMQTKKYAPSECKRLIVFA